MAKDTFVRIEFDLLGIILVSNDALSVTTAVALVRADTEKVSRVTKLPEQRQIAHPVDRSDPVATGNVQRFQVDLKSATITRVYAEELVKTLEKQLRCEVVLKKMN